ncbi:MAG: M48 family metallopeptidase [Balneolia bacterium]|nr:M48 family metallopeptidase [Balneolia bacterium]
MDFFKAQDDARRNTKKLVFFYILAVAGLIISIYLAAFFLLAGGGSYLGAETGALSFWMPGLFWSILIFTLIVISAGTGYRVIQLRSGGSAVAEMMGGRRITPATTDPKERRLMNVIEEMSIASGVPVPSVYVMDNEDGINAFAAGYGARDAAIGVTKGCLEHLDRDELQGVMAHEFSHIFNGDMRLNIRLIGILNGILVIHLIGMILMRSQMYVRIGGGGRNRGQAALAMMAFGLALTAIGYLGVIFGRMIQSAVSRQREYLADAAAVQFTRNPEGIASALAKIQLLHEGSFIKDPHAAEMSHLFFSTGQRTWLNSLFATHPPVKKRLEAMNATHVVEAVKKRMQREHEQKASESERERQKREREEKQKKAALPGFKSGADVFTPEGLVAAAGTVTALQLSGAQMLLDQLSERIIEDAHDLTGAQNLMYALLLSTDREVRLTQVDALRPSVTNEQADNAHQLFRHVQELPSHYHISLVDVALPALRSMSKKQYDVFRANIDMLIKADGRQVIFEFAVRQILFHSLDAHFDKKQEEKIRYSSVEELIPGFSLILSALSHVSGGTAEESFNAATEELKKQTGRDIPVKLLQASDITMSKLEEAMDSLSQSTGEIHKQFLETAAAAIAADGKLNQREISLLRAIAAAIDIPLPLMVASE